MKKLFSSSLHRKTAFVVSIALACFSVSFSQSLKQAEDYIIDRTVDANGREMVRIVVPGQPSKDFRMPPASPAESSVMLPGVPAYDWCFGCSATSAAMMAGYYDRTGYPNMYTGPTNYGVAPLNNSIWGQVVINGETRSQCPFSATRQGLDGRSTRGHVDDYWVQYGHPGPDPYITNGWVQHTHADCTGDFMKTSQSVYNNSDGATTFWYYLNGAPTTLTVNDDGTYGLRLFFESRGYSVVTYFNQYIYGYNGNTQGFTFQQYKQQIDAGRPVLIQVAGHTMLGLGYNDAGSLVYLHDTWDYTLHQMAWGGNYANMQHYGVGVIQLQPIVTNPCEAFLPIEGCGPDFENTYWGGGTGQWFNTANNACAYTTPGLEQVYRFEVPFNGFYSLQVTTASGAVNYMWQVGSCSSTGWQCIAQISSPGQYGSLNLTAGNILYLLLDDRDNTQGQHTFYLNCPNHPLPFYEAFNSASWPSMWQQTYSGNITSPRWNVNNTSNAGGSPFEMHATWIDAVGTTRLILPPLNTTGFTQIQLIFRQCYFDWGPGCTLRIQSSSDGSTWTNEAWSFNSGSGNIQPTITIVPIQNNLGGSLYLAFVIIGNHYQFDDWYIDNVQVTGTPVVPTNLTVQNQSVLNGSNVCFNASQTIFLAGSGTYFTIEPGASATCVAGQNIFMLTGTHAKNGSLFLAYITTTSTYCPSAKSESTDQNQVSFNNETGIGSDNPAITVLPNPNNGECIVSIAEKVFTAPVLVEVISAMGETVFRTSSQSTSRIALNLNFLPSGIHYVRVTDGKTAAAVKMIKW